MQFLVVSLALTSLACGNGGDEGSDEAASSETSPESGTATTQDGESGTMSSTTDMTSSSTDAESSTDMTSASTDDEATTDASSTDADASTDASSTDADTSSTDASSTDSSTTDATTESTTDDGANCLPAEIACDGMDEDCNDVIDDLDEEQDGFCDCYNIGIIGTAGANPAANFEAWLEDKGTSATRFGTDVNHVLTDADLEPYDILIVDRLTHVYSPAERQILADWLAAGHGMIVMAGYTNNDGDRANQNSLGSAAGLTYEQPIYLNPTEVWENHPIAMGAQTVQIYGGWRVVGAGEVFVRPQGEPNNSFGTAAGVGMGDAIVFSDEWISFDSEWQAIPEVPVFWSNMIKWVGPKDFCFDPQ